MPEPIALSETIQPIELSPNCAIDDEAEVRVSVAGIGRKFLAQRLVDADGLLRHTTFATCPRSEYDDISYDVEGKNIPSIILARAEDGSDLGPGDSGIVEIKWSYLMKIGTFIGKIMCFYLIICRWSSASRD